LSFDELLSTTPGTTNVQTISQSETLKLDDVTREHILYVLKKTNGKIHGPGGAAQILDINASTLRNRMRNLGINYSRYNKHTGTT
jgi:transcriptional regulator with GAF, ATPase, and Fis domain